MPPYQNKELVTLYKAHEATKKQEYGERIRDGGMAHEGTIFKRLADLLNVKKQLPYSLGGLLTEGWLWGFVGELVIYIILVYYFNNIIA